MESTKQTGSSSSFPSDLFGPKESPPSVSAGSFASVFPPPPSMATGRKSSGSEFMGYTQKQSSGNHSWNTKQATEIMGKRSDGSNNSTSNKGRNSIFQENAETCPLSSSLYYGGQEDMYVSSSGPQASGYSNPTFKKDAAEDDPNGNNSQAASRGNWWQGSLYY